MVEKKSKPKQNVNLSVLPEYSEIGKKVIKEKLNPRIDQFIHFVTLNSFSEIPTYLKKKIEVRVELTENVQIKSSYEGRELVSTNLNKVWKDNLYKY